MRAMMTFGPPYHRSITCSTKRSSLRPRNDKKSSIVRPGPGLPDAVDDVLVVACVIWLVRGLLIFRAMDVRFGSSEPWSVPVRSPRVPSELVRGSMLGACHALPKAVSIKEPFLIRE